MAGPAEPPATPPADLSAGAARYLEAIYYIHHEGEVVRPGRLAEWLGVAAPSVTEALSRLARDGLVTTGAGRSVLFTATGHVAAEDVVRRHRIAEVWLFRTLGFDWVTADAEAHRVAHSLSDTVLARLQESLGNPRTCPHGNAIPGVPQPEQELIRLVELPRGQPARVARISEVVEQEAPALLDVLFRSGIVPGAETSLVGSAAGTTVELTVGDRPCIRLATADAANVWVVDPASRPAAPA
ncbi:MAG: metal-dependent transcriptional regulator [Actinomycetota bacterium]|nr:metal-dependent transcriptional regulator [Actinomycetota bacterium]